MKLGRKMGTLCVLGAVHFGCGIDLADTTEGLDQETLEGEGPKANNDDTPKECREWLRVISSGLKTYAETDSLNNLLKREERLPDGKMPQSEARPMNPKDSVILNSIGAKVPKGLDKVHGTFDIQIKGAASYSVLCILDDDQDGKYDAWEVTDSEPIQQVSEDSDG